MSTTQLPGNRTARGSAYYQPYYVDTGAGWRTFAATMILIGGLAILAGAMWARVAGVIVASLNLIFQLAYLAHFPFWSFTMILIDTLVIYALVVHGHAPTEDDLVLSE